VERAERELLDRVERPLLVERLALLVERPDDVERAEDVERPEDVEREPPDLAREPPDERAPVDLLRELLVVRRLEPLLDLDPDPDDPRLAWGMFPPWDCVTGFGCTLLHASVRTAGGQRHLRQQLASARLCES